MTAVDTAIVLADRFLEAPTLDQFIEGTVENRDLWLSIRRRARVSEELVERLRSLSPPRHLVVLTEDWCGDACNTMPYLAALVEAVPQLEARAFLRNRNLDLMDSHLTGSARAIPVVIVYDEDWRETGWWGSRPEPLQRWVASPDGQELSKEDRYREVRRWYSRDQGRTTLAEIGALLLYRTA